MTSLKWVAGGLSIGLIRLIAEHDLFFLELLQCEEGAASACVAIVKVVLAREMATTATASVSFIFSNLDIEVS